MVSISVCWPPKRCVYNITSSSLLHRKYLLLPCCLLKVSQYRLALIDTASVYIVEGIFQHIHITAELGVPEKRAVFVKYIYQVYIYIAFSWDFLSFAKQVIYSPGGGFQGPFGLLQAGAHARTPHISKSTNEGGVQKAVTSIGRFWCMFNRLAMGSLCPEIDSKKRPRNTGYSIGECFFFVIQHAVGTY